MAAYDDVRGLDAAGDISRLAHDNRSAGIGVARNVALNVPLNAQNARRSDIAFNAQVGADQGIGRRDSAQV
jgi:hypothetical protein